MVGRSADRLTLCSELRFPRSEVRLQFGGRYLVDHLWKRLVEYGDDPEECGAVAVDVRLGQGMFGCDRQALLALACGTDSRDRLHLIPSALSVLGVVTFPVELAQVEQAEHQEFLVAAVIEDVVDATECRFGLDLGALSKQAGDVASRLQHRQACSIWRHPPADLWLRQTQLIITKECHPASSVNRSDACTPRAAAIARMLSRPTLRC